MFVFAMVWAKKSLTICCAFYRGDYACVCLRERERDRNSDRKRGKRNHYNPKNTMESNLAGSNEATDTCGRNTAIVSCISSHQAVKSIFPPCEPEVALGLPLIKHCGSSNTRSIPMLRFQCFTDSICVRESSSEEAQANSMERSPGRAALADPPADWALECASLHPPRNKAVQSQLGPAKCRTVR